MRVRSKPIRVKLKDFVDAIQQKREEQRAMPNEALQIIDALREWMRVREANQTEAAKELGVSHAYLSDVLHGNCKPGKKLLAAMGWERVVTYRPMPKPKRRARNE